MFVVLIVICLVLLCLSGTRNHDYWRKRGIKYEKPLPFFGGNLKQIIMGISLAERFSKLYSNYPNERYTGFFIGNKPTLLIRDPRFIKHILSTDFNYFHNRGANPSKDSSEMLMKSLFFVEDDMWKLMRQNLAPAFTLAKLRSIFPLIEQRAIKMSETVVDGLEIDTRELMARYVMDFIGVCGFGVDPECSQDVIEFRRFGKRIVTKTVRDTIVLILKFSAPEMFKHFNIFPSDVHLRTKSIIEKVMTQRNFQPSIRQDFIDLMLEMKQRGYIIGESMKKDGGSNLKLKMEVDDALLMSQVFTFFVAGFESSSTAVSMLLHHLTYNPSEQARCQQEIDEVLKKYNGQLCYDAVKEMQYLEICLKESLRMFPSPGFVVRTSTEQYTFPDTNLTIDQGVTVVIPVQGLHLDEKYFEDPLEFKPERFSSQNVNNIKKYTYLPFGAGPRACIAERMAMMLSLTGAAAILRKFQLNPSKNSIERPLVDFTSTIAQYIVNGLPLEFRLRQF